MAGLRESAASLSAIILILRTYFGPECLVGLDDRGQETLAMTEPNWLKLGCIDGER